MINALHDGVTLRLSEKQISYRASVPNAIRNVLHVTKGHRQTDRQTLYYSNGRDKNVKFLLERVHVDIDAYTTSRRVSNPGYVMLRCRPTPRHHRNFTGNVYVYVRYAKHKSPVKIKMQRPNFLASGYPLLTQEQVKLYGLQIWQVYS